MEQAIKDQVVEVLNSVVDVYDKDEVFPKLFTLGIPFTKIPAVYREVGIERGLIIDTAKAKEEIYKDLAQRSITSFEDYDAVEELCSSIMDNINAPEDYVLKVMRAYYKEQEVTMPRKSREYAPRGPRGGKVAEAMVDYAYATPPKELTKKGMYDAVLPHVKAPKNAYDAVNAMFLTIYAIHNNLTYEKAVDVVKGLELLNLVELEAAYVPTPANPAE